MQHNPSGGCGVWGRGCAVREDDDGEEPVNLFFILVIIKDKLTDLCGN